MPRRLRHASPDSIRVEDHIFYITQCALPRGQNILLPCAGSLVSSICHYHDNGSWFCHAYVIMPDHVHLLIQTDGRIPLGTTLRNWKRFTARQQGIKWQRDFFDHRLRSEESAAEKARYMELNPVRAGLASEDGQWKWFGYCGAVGSARPQLPGPR
jgi:REP element-mobilizing transposase RayT